MSHRVTPPHVTLLATHPAANLKLHPASSVFRKADADEWAGLCLAYNNARCFYDDDGKKVITLNPTGEGMRSEHFPEFLSPQVL